MGERAYEPSFKTRFNRILRVRPGGIFSLSYWMPKQCDMPGRDTNGRGTHKAFRTCGYLLIIVVIPGFPPQNYKVHHEDIDADISTDP